MSDFTPQRATNWLDETNALIGDWFGTTSTDELKAILLCMTDPTPEVALRKLEAKMGAEILVSIVCSLTGRIYKERKEREAAALVN